MLPLESLLQAAREARTRAYAPYSDYHVGAALETNDGAIVVGCNVENLSYGATICAERTATSSMIAGGHGRGIVQLVVATENGGTPCGICLQFLREFMKADALVHCTDEAGAVTSYRFGDLMPHAFTFTAHPRTDSKEPAV
jgi:cytidine deaminase